MTKKKGQDKKIINDVLGDMEGYNIKMDKLSFVFGSIII